MTDGNVGIGTSTPYIGIDPGKSGGIAVICGDEINAAKCPEKFIRKELATFVGS